MLFLLLFFCFFAVVFSPSFLLSVFFFFSFLYSVVVVVCVFLLFQKQANFSLGGHTSLFLLVGFCCVIL